MNKTERLLRLALEDWLDEPILESELICFLECLNDNDLEVKKVVI